MMKEKKIYIQTELSLQNAVKLYNALNPIGQIDFFGNLSNPDAKLLQPEIRKDHKRDTDRCNCFACIVWIE